MTKLLSSDMRKGLRTVKRNENRFLSSTDANSKDTNTVAKDIDVTPKNSAGNVIKMQANIPKGNEIAGKAIRTYLGKAKTTNANLELSKHENMEKANKAHLEIIKLKKEKDEIKKEKDKLLEQANREKEEAKIEKR